MLGQQVGSKKISSKYNGKCFLFIAIYMSFERCQIIGSSFLKTAVRGCFDFNPFYSRELLSEQNYLSTGNKEESL